MIHFCSDTHWFHQKIRLYSKRDIYYSTEEMNQGLIDNWNKVVAPNDIVWHLGDFAFCNYLMFAQLLKQLNGTINVVLGNHDKIIRENKNKLIGCGLLNSIQDYHELNVDNQLYILFHYGMRVWRNSHYGSIMLYGHSHGSLPPLGKSVDVGVDSKEITTEYRPVSLDEVNKYMSTRKFVAVDHHVER